MSNDDVLEILSDRVLMVLDPLNEEGFFAHPFLGFDHKRQIVLFFVKICVQPFFDLNEVFFQSKRLLVLVKFY